MPTLSLKQRLDRMTADEVAAGHGITRVTVYERLKSGKLTDAAFSRTWWTRQRPHGRFSYFHVFETVLNILLELHGSEYVAGHIAAHHAGLSRAVARHILPPGQLTSSEPIKSLVTADALTLRSLDAPGEEVLHDTL